MASVRRTLSPLPALLVALLALFAASPAHALRVATWNLHEYPQTNGSARHPAFRTVVAGLNADALIVQELSSQAGADSFLYNVLQVAEPAKLWRKGGYLVTTESVVFYDSAKVAISNVGSLATAGPRDVYVCLLRPLGYAAGPATTLRLYSIHFKAGNPSFTPADSTTRRQECTDIRNVLNTAPAGTNLLLGGDTNFYGAWEGGYLRLTESQTDNDGRLFDPLSMPGTWNSNIAYAPYDTQCPCLAQGSDCPPNFSGGGMDDRFDLWLSSPSLQDGEALDLIPSGNMAYGNDGSHFNDAINGGGFNNAVGITIANALHDASDHLPVLFVLQVPAKVSAVSQLPFGSAIVGGTAVQTLAVSNSAALPGDELNYVLVTPVGFSAPGGSFIANAGAAANMHLLSMSSATAGVKTGTLTIASDDPDSASKSVQLSGTVLRHAAASLESLTVTLADTLDFGDLPIGGFAGSKVTHVHNRGFDALQARLAVNAGVMTGGGGRFTLVGGFAPAVVGGVSAAWPVHFDDTGATTDSTYFATLTFSSTDEALPGAAGAPDLVVTLRARPTSGNIGVPPGQPTTLRFYPPRPNPLARTTRFAFDLPRAAAVSLEVFDLSGRRVARLVDGAREAGHHEVGWTAADENGGRLAAGLYFARFSVGGISRMERLVLLP
jgi:endonuclease/exonuclease/phosphatase family metal-dependent hydrolase